MRKHFFIGLVVALVAAVLLGLMVPAGAASGVVRNSRLPAGAVQEEPAAAEVIPVNPLAGAANVGAAIAVPVALQPGHAEADGPPPAGGGPVATPPAGGGPVDPAPPVLNASVVVCFLQLAGLPRGKIVSFRFAMTNTNTMVNTGGGGSGKPQALPLVVTKPYDRTSPVLAQACAQGKHFPEATLEIREAQAGGNARLVMKYRLADVLISGVQAFNAGDGRLLEEVSLSFAGIEWTYDTVMPTGGAGPDTQFHLGTIPPSG